MPRGSAFSPHKPSYSNSCQKSKHQVLTCPKLWLLFPADTRSERCLQVCVNEEICRGRKNSSVADEAWKARCERLHFSSENPSRLGTGLQLPWTMQMWLALAGYVFTSQKTKRRNERYQDATIERGQASHSSQCFPR